MCSSELTLFTSSRLEIPIFLSTIPLFCVLSTRSGSFSVSLAASLLISTYLQNVGLSYSNHNLSFTLPCVIWFYFYHLYLELYICSFSNWTSPCGCHNLLFSAPGRSLRVVLLSTLTSSLVRPVTQSCLFSSYYSNYYSLVSLCLCVVFFFLHYFWTGSMAPVGRHLPNML